MNEVLRERGVRRVIRVVAARPIVGQWVLRPLVRDGYRRYLRTEQTPRLAFRAMRKLFGNDDASLFEDVAETASAEAGMAVLRPNPSGVAAGEIDRAVSDLRRDGYSILQSRMSADVCRDLESIARSATCTVIVPGDDRLRRQRFDERAPIGIRYDLDEEDILHSAAAQRLVADESLLAVAQEYLGTTPVQDLVAMWWSTAVSQEPSSPAAQAFHFDLDRLRFVKVFVYVSDVDDETGPHVYVRGSHRSLPRELRDDRRYGDDEIARHYGRDVVKISGPAGTTFLADTRGLHKGLGLSRGSRLVFQLEFACSLFGQQYSRPRIDSPVRELTEMQQRYTRTFGRFRLTGQPDPV